MIFSKKVETVGSIKDFLAESPGKIVGQAVTAGALAGMATVMLTRTDLVFASGVADKIIRAFDPIIQLVQGLSYPVGFIMITAGCLVIMTGNKQKGLNMIKWAAIGYIGMQFAPAIMTILVEVGKAMAK
jgi:formate/nitrite transporter FocA (FNT family)